MRLPEGLFPQNINMITLFPSSLISITSNFFELYENPPPSPTHRHRIKSCFRMRGPLNWNKEAPKVVPGSWLSQMVPGIPLGPIATVDTFYFRPCQQSLLYQSSDRLDFPITVGWSIFPQTSYKKIYPPQNCPAAPASLCQSLGCGSGRGCPDPFSEIDLMSVQNQMFLTICTLCFVYCFWWTQVSFYRPSPTIKYIIRKIFHRLRLC